MPRYICFNNFINKIRLHQSLLNKFFLIRFSLKLTNEISKELLGEYNGKWNLVVFESKTGLLLNPLNGTILIISNIL